jgi:hypothetical protein
VTVAIVFQNITLFDYILDIDGGLLIGFWGAQPVHASVLASSSNSGAGKESKGIKKWIQVRIRAGRH